MHHRHVLKYFLVSVVIIALASQKVNLSINLSSSLPQKVFLVVKGIDVHLGDYVVFYPPLNQFFDSKTPFIKIVGGVVGNTVTQKHNTFYVNGKLIGIAKSISSKGFPLTKGQTGVIPKNYYFVYSPHPRSFDSRYKDIGWIEKSRIIGRAYPLF